VADQRNPPRRPPALPLPPPPPEDLPRLPEVRVDDSAEVRLDLRALAPNRNSLAGARAVNPRAGRPTAPEKPKKGFPFKPNTAPGYP